MANLNSLEKSKMYLDTILEVFKRNSLTAPMDSLSQQFDWLGADELRVLKIETNGLGDYQKDVGYPQGAISATWDTMKLATDRGVKFLLDRIDDEETLALTMGRVADNFTKMQMIPELDAYRFSRYANGAGTSVTETLNSNNILDALNLAKVHMNTKDVPSDGRLLYVNQDLEIHFLNAVKRVWGSDSAINTEILNYNGMKIVFVPKNRFQTLIQLNSGENNQWGYQADPASKDINFMLIYPQAVVQAAKTAKGKFVSANEPATMIDSDIFMFRIFHDAFVIDRLKDGVYLNVKAVTP